MDVGVETKSKKTTRPDDANAVAIILSSDEQNSARTAAVTHSALMAHLDYLAPGTNHSASR
jgi:hypothetical protein